MSNVGPGVGSGDTASPSKGRGRGLLHSKKTALRSPHPETRAKLDSPSASPSSTPCQISQSTSPERSTTPSQFSSVTSPSPSSTDVSSQASPKTPSAIKMSTLSADAQAFVPSQLSAAAPVFVPSGGASQTNTNNIEDVYPEVVELVQSTLNQLSANPGAFSHVFSGLKDSLEVSAHVEGVLCTVIDIIFERAIQDTNLRYSAARICSHLSDRLRAGCGSGNFRQLLMKKCHTEFNIVQQYLKDPQNVNKLYGYTLFMGELFLGLVITVQDGSLSRVNILRGAVMNLLQLLISYPTDGALKCVVQMLKFCGSAIDDDLKRDGESQVLDDFISKLRVVMLEDGLSKSSRQIVANVIDLRSTNWGRLPSPSPSTNQNFQYKPPSPFTQTEPVFYNQKGQIITRDEAGFTQDNTFLPDGTTDTDYGVWNSDTPQDDSDLGEYEDEIAEAYEQFLLDNN